jgi:hypothetical protein
MIVTFVCCLSLALSIVQKKLWRRELVLAFVTINCQRVVVRIIPLAQVVHGSIWIQTRSLSVLL